MESYSQKELNEAVELIASTIRNCEKMKLKFEEGTSQNTLLKNRIQALEISKVLIENKFNKEQYSKADLEQALPPVVSIINKTEKARSKYIQGTTQYQRFTPLINTMYIAKSFIENEMVK